MNEDRELQLFAQAFRCTPEMAPTYVARIHERMGHEVPMGNILAAMKKIAPKRLSMDTLVEQLKKMELRPTRARASKAANGDPAAEPAARPAAKTLRPAPKASPMDQIGKILSANWERGRKQGIKVPAMTAEKFVKTAQSIAGTPKPTVARVLQAIIKLDRRDILLTPNLVADEINESDKT
jgi:hypothetical protein